MSAAMVASSLNPDAPLFVPAAFEQVEDFSPQWWDLVKSTAWFRDHWYRQHQQLDDMADSLLAFEADDDLAVDGDLFHGSAVPAPAPLKTDVVLKSLSLASPKGGDALRRHTEKPSKYAGSPRSVGAGAPRFIHQPR